MTNVFKNFALPIAAGLATIPVQFALTQPALAQAAPDPVGAWQGVLKIPNSVSLRLFITVSRTADGALKAELESPDQAAGQKIPTTTIAMQGEELSFTIDALQLSYKGKWVAAEQTWQGIFTQGGQLPLTLSRK